MLHLVSRFDFTCVFLTSGFLEKTGPTCELHSGDGEPGPNEPTELNPKKNHWPEESLLLASGHCQLPAPLTDATERTQTPMRGCHDRHLWVEKPLVRDWKYPQPSRQQKVFTREQPGGGRAHRHVSTKAASRGEAAEPRPAGPWAVGAVSSGLVAPSGGWRHTFGCATSRVVSGLSPGPRELHRSSSASVHNRKCACKYGPRQEVGAAGSRLSYSLARMFTIQFQDRDRGGAAS